MTKRLVHLLVLALAGPMALSCASRSQAQVDSAPPDAGGNVSPDVRGDLPPAGYGTLNQNNLAVNLRTEELEVRFLPLDERVLRLLAPDAYRSLRDLVASKRAAVDSLRVPAAGLVLVTFFSLKPDVLFDAYLAGVEVRSRQYRPIGVVPYSANFSSGQLRTREQATGILVFEEELSVYEPMTFSYGLLSTSAWRSNLTRIERERARVTAAAQAAEEKQK